jgi:hypothetical protein
MKNNLKEEKLQYFTPLYILNKLYPEDGLMNPDKYENDEAFLQELQKLQEQDPELINELSEAASDESGKYDMIWNKVDQLLKTNSILKSASGAKLNKLKKLKSMKKSSPKKCKCGCDMIEVKEDGGKIVSKCSCNCGGGKIKTKQKGGILNRYDLDLLLDSGTVDSSIINK